MSIQKQPINKFSRYSFIIIVLVSILILSYAIRNPLTPEEKKLTYSKFLTLVVNQQIAEVTIVTQGNKLKGKLANGKKFTVDAPEDPDLVKTLREAGVPFSAENPGFKENIASFLMVILVPAAVILVLWFLIIRQAQGGGGQAMSFGRSKAKLMTDSMPKATFDDVAGVDEAKQELEEIVEFLKSPEKFQAVGAKIPKGVLLVGPPGSGKTLLARAIAGEADVPFYHMSGSDFVEMFVGVGASRVRDMFQQAKKNAPCLVFVDEIDAVGRQRGAGLGGGHDEREQTLNQLLVEMDGFDQNSGVILLAATNRPDVLDPALLRPGRFDRRIVVDRPDLIGRKAILDVHARDKPIDDAVDLNVIARRTPGFTGADLSNLLNEAAILAARQETQTIRMEQIEESIERIIAGPERRSRLLSEREKRNTAFHEAGHALVAKMLPGTDPVHKISILPRGMALGYTLQLPLEDKYSQLKTDLTNNICVLLGGRIAEKLMMDEISTGAANDLERATKIARRMICEFGMSDALGPLTFGKKEDMVFMGRDLGSERNYSEVVAAKIDMEARSIIDSCYEKAEDILTDKKERLKLIAEKLIARETLDGVLLENLLNGKDLPEEEIEKLEKERREKIALEMKETRAREEKEKNDKADPEDVESTGECTTIDALASSVAPSEVEFKAVGGLLGKFRDLLYDTFDKNFRPQLEKSVGVDRFASLNTALDNGNMDDAQSILKEIIKENSDGVVRAGSHLRLALIYTKLGRADLVPDELMSALQSGADKIEKNAERVLVSAISYFRIINEELSSNKIQFENLLANAGRLEIVDEKYRRWEEKTSENSSSFFPMT